MSPHTCAWCLCAHSWTNTFHDGEVNVEVLIVISGEKIRQVCFLWHTAEVTQEGFSPWMASFATTPFLPPLAPAANGVLCTPRVCCIHQLWQAWELLSTHGPWGHTTWFSHRVFSRGLFFSVSHSPGSSSYVDFSITIVGFCSLCW